jgi:hypothetical protein
MRRTEIEVYFKMEKLFVIKPGIPTNPKKVSGIGCLNFILKSLSVKIEAVYNAEHQVGNRDFLTKPRKVVVVYRVKAAISSEAAISTLI